MFWQSVITGIKLLGYWQVWFVVLLHVLIYSLFLFLSSFVLSKVNNTKTSIFFMLINIGGSIVQVILMGFVIAFLLPILLFKIPSLSSSSFIISKFWLIIKASLVAFFVIVILLFIPLIGTIIAKLPSVQTFLIGVIIFRIISNSVIMDVIAKSDLSIPEAISKVLQISKIYPSIWEILGFLILGGLINLLVLLGSALIFSSVKNSHEANVFLYTFFLTLGAVLGYLPLFMYASYVQLSLLKI